MLTLLKIITVLENSKCALLKLKLDEKSSHMHCNPQTICMQAHIVYDHNGTI